MRMPAFVCRLASQPPPLRKSCHFPTALSKLAKFVAMMSVLGWLVPSVASSWRYATKEQDNNALFSAPLDPGFPLSSGSSTQHG